MASKSKLSAKHHSRLKVISARHPTGLWLGVVGIVLSISACGLSGQVSPTPEVPVPTATAQSTASIKGTLWHDLCVNDSTQVQPLSGCVIDAASGNIIANGVLETGEPGIPDVRIELGRGVCPSSGLSEVMTNAEGRYAIEGLWPGEYCVSVKFGVSHQPASIVPGIWTYPKSGMQTIALEHGERRVDVNFGWDYLHIPALSTSEPTPEPSPAPSCVDSAGFIKDVTIPDGSRIDPGDSFSKIWRLRNNGSCTWTSDYDLVFYSGDRMSGYYAVPLRGGVNPGETVDLSIELVAPKSVGTFWGHWMLRNAEGGIFGIGEDGSSPFWVKIFSDPEITEWRGEYFDNQKLDGDPVLIRNDKEIDFNWKDDAPSSSLPANNFSVRWTRQLKFNTATYRFSILVDDGARLWVDDRLVIDEWDEGSARTVSVDLAMSKGKHDLKLEFFEHAGSARIFLDLDKVTVHHDEDWIANYWFNRTMDSEWALVKTVDKVEFDWGSGSPALGIPDDDFSARWSRVVDFEPGIYRVYARADDGIRVELDGNRVIDEWHSSNASEIYAAEVSLSGSTQVDVEYFERGGAAKVSLWWEYLGAANEPPMAIADVYEALENEVLIVPAPGVLSNDEDQDGGNLIASLVSGTSNGTIALDPDGSFVYLPNTDFIGKDRFAYRISDGELASGIASVTVTVKSTNSPPIANGDKFVVSQAEVLKVPAPGVLENDFDLDEQPLQVLLEEEPLFGRLILYEDGSFDYAPPVDFNGDDQFSYRLSDGIATSELATVQIKVLPVNDHPQAAVSDRIEWSCWSRESHARA